MKTLFDFGRFLRDNFTDQEGLSRKLALYKLPVPNEDAARKWFDRNSVPAHWFPILIVALTLDGWGLTALTKYVLGGRKRV